MGEYRGIERAVQGETALGNQEVKSLEVLISQAKEHHRFEE